MERMVAGVAQPASTYSAMHIHKDISAHPTSGGLAHPSTLDNRLDIQRQVEDNLRIWRALEALRNG